MNTDKFFEKMVSEEYVDAGPIRRWWERLLFNIWLKAPTHPGSNETNRDFVEQIPD